MSLNESKGDAMASYSHEMRIRDLEQIKLIERELCAKMLELKPDEIRLMAGEMTAAEMRLVQAVLKNRAAVIRGNV